MIQSVLVAALVIVAALSQFAHGEVSNRCVLLHLNRLGLANRLRAVADWYQVARLTQRTLLLSWVPSPDCNAHFHDLFDDGPDGLQVLMAPLPDSAMAIAQYIAQEQQLTFTSLPDEIDFLVNRTLLESNIDILYTDHNGVVALGDVKCQQHMYLRSRFYRSLVPVQSIRDTVEAIRNEHFQSKYFHSYYKRCYDFRLVIGVHIRMHDPRFDWAVVPPVGAGATAAEFGHTATISDFRAQMTSIAAKYNHEVLFFIASNSRDVRVELQRYMD